MWGKSVSFGFVEYISEVVVFLGNVLEVYWGISGFGSPEGRVRRASAVKHECLSTIHLHTLAKAAALMMAMLREDCRVFRGEGFGGGEFGGLEVIGSYIVADLAANVGGDSCVGAVQRVMLFSTQSINRL